MIPLALACLWLIAANVIAILPSRDRHWRAAWVLIALGLPLALWLGLAAGGGWAALFLAAAASILRWPVWFLLRRLAGRRG